MREQGGVTEVNSIGVEAPGSLGLCAHSHQVVNTFLLVVFCWVFLQNNSGNLHQILLSRYYFRKEPNQRISGGRPVLGRAILVALVVKNPPTMQDTRVQPLGQEDLLE